MPLCQSHFAIEILNDSSRLRNESKVNSYTEIIIKVITLLRFVEAYFMIQNISFALGYQILY